jgi:glyoxylase-like metal-dependent hydrolase (beta-lactamase superfamily II)
MRRNQVVWAAAVLAFTVTLVAQPPAGTAGAAKAGAAVEKIRPLKPDLYMITGGGANTLVRVTPEGLIVVDTKNPGDENYNRLMEEIRSVSPLPVKWVINTQHHPDHVGTNQKFIDAGARVLAAEPLARYMVSDPRTKDIPGRPQVTFARNYTLQFGGARVDLQFLAPGHSGGDTLVVFPEEKVVMVGDQMSDATPIIDFANGGSLKSWNALLDGALAAGFEWAIPGRGEPKTRAEVQAFRDKMAAVAERAAAAAKAGAATFDTSDLGWQFPPATVAAMIAEMR